MGRRYFDKRVICTYFGNGKQHDFKLFKESKTHISPYIKCITDSGYLGINKYHTNSAHPKKRSKKNPLSIEDKVFNRLVSRQRVFNENVICIIKRFKIMADKYRNRHKRFSIRFNLIAGIYNFEINM